jgi:hypothetical protein
MGSSLPKSDEEEGQKVPRKLYGVELEILEVLQDAVKDAIVDGTEDAILLVLIETTLVEICDGRPLFQNPLDEPFFYRKYFKPWVSAGIQELRAMESIRDKTNKTVLGNEG